MKNGRKTHTHPFDKYELLVVYGKGSAGNAASNTFPGFRRRLKEHVRYDKLSGCSKLAELFAMVSAEVDAEIEADRQQQFEAELPERIARQAGGRGITIKQETPNAS